MTNNQTSQNIFISYAITVCNEVKELSHLIKTLYTYKRDNDEIIVLFDNSKKNTEIKSFLIY